MEPTVLSGPEETSAPPLQSAEEGAVSLSGPRGGVPTGAGP